LAHGAYSGLAARKLDLLLDPSYNLCREDMVWVLEYIKSKLASKDPSITKLSQARLIENFHYFTEIAMLLVHPGRGCDYETDRIRAWMNEATYGLRPGDP
jgi:hypothetical protein